MLAIDREVKDAINSAERKNLILSFDDGTTIDNEDIAMESMELEQSISEEELLKFGGINSACFKVKIKGTTKEYKNLWFNASLNVGDYSLPLGRFFVYSDFSTSDRKYREIVAYDSLFVAMNKDVSEWYNGLTFPISIYDMRNSLFDYLQIEQIETELINDSYMVDRTLDGNGITGLMVLQAICELNAVFGVINAYGQFKYVQINNLSDSGLFPSEDLYPSEDLFPQDIYDDCLSKADYRLGSLSYEEFETKNITKVTIREEVNDVGVSVGEDGNTYAIEDNFLVYGDTEENLTVVAQNIFDYAKHLTYTPAFLKCNGKPWREVGDIIQVYADNRVFHMPIMNRVLNGIQALTDTYSSKGRETYEEQQEVGYKAEIKQLKSRTNVLTRTLDETRSEITRVETELEENYPTTSKMNSVISQKADEIELEVSRVETKTETYGKNFLLDTKEEKNISDKGSYINYKFVDSKQLIENQKLILSFTAIATETGGAIDFEYVSENDYIASAGSITINPGRQRYSIELYKIADTTDVQYLQFYNRTSIQMIVSEVKLEIGDVVTDYSPASNDIVTTNTVVSSINLSLDTVEIKGNRIIIESDNFKLTENGSIEMLSGTIKIQGTVRKLASDYTESDAERANSIALGNIYPTVSDFEKLDLNGDGVINITDIIRINRLLQGMDEYWDIPTNVEINPLATQNVITTEGVSIGMNGGFLKTINSENAYFENIYVMNVGNGFSKGASGSFVDGNGNTVAVINGIITSIS